jgi:SAM-dependent methyltransferase
VVVDNPNTIEHWDEVYGYDCSLPMNECYRYDEHRFREAIVFVSGHTLDYGCGLGYFSRYCLDKDISIDGCDWSEVALAQARRVCPSLNFYKYGEVEISGYDCVSLQEVIEHLDDPIELLGEIDGRVIITTPLTNGSGILHSGEHVKEYSEEELANLVSFRFDVIHSALIECRYGQGILLIADRKKDV